MSRSIPIARVPLSAARAAEFTPALVSREMDVESEVARIPPTARIAGMFLQPVVEEAGARGVTLPHARQRYTRRMPQCPE